MMDQDDVEACGMANGIGHFHSSELPDLLVNTKGLSDHCGVNSDGNLGLEKQSCGSISEYEVNSCESAKSLERERQYLNRSDISSTDCSKEHADESRLVSSATPASRNSELKKEICTKGSSVVIPYYNRLTGSGSVKDCDISAHSPGGIDSTQDISMKSDVNLDGIQRLSKDTNELIGRRMKKRCLDAGEDGSHHNKQLKTESSSSNSTRAILPASSIDSCQETSVDAKSCEHSKCTGTDTSTYTDLKSSLEEPAVKCRGSGMATLIAPNDGLYIASFSTEKQGRVCKPSEIADSLGTKDHDKLPGMTVNSNPMTLEKSDLQKSHLHMEEHTELLKVKPCYELNDALEVARRVAREVEQEAGMYKEASGSCSSIQERSCETVHLSSVDSAASNKNCLTETGSKVRFGNERDKCNSFCSTKVEVDPVISMRNEVLCLEVKEPLQGMGLMKKHETNNGLNVEGSCPLITKPDEKTATDQPTCVSRIDLNENIFATEVGCLKQSIKETVSGQAETVSKPVPVVAKPGIHICLSKPLLQLDGEAGGWRGSATTSAFRPTALPDSFNATKASSAMDSNNGSKSSEIKGFDLNIPAEADDCVMEMLSKKCAQAMSSFPAKESSVEINSTQAERLDIDLNRVGESEDTCHQLSPPASLSGHFVRDFDLNNNPMPADVCIDFHQPGQGTAAFQGRMNGDTMTTFLGNARQTQSNLGSSYVPDLSPMQTFSHGHAKPFLMAAPNMPPSIEQVHNVASLQQRPLVHNVASLQQRPTYAVLPPPSLPLHAFTYNNAILIDSNNQLSSTVYPPGVIPYITDPRATTAFPQILGSSAFSGTPQLMQVPVGPGPSDIATIRPSVDPNVVLTSLGSGTLGGNARQGSIPVNNASGDQMRSLQQLALYATTMKRQESEGGWDSHQLSFRQMPWWR